MDTAKAISTSLSVAATVTELASQLERRLGGDHPLTTMARVRVAYHHGSLPRDVQAAIEEALADGTLRVVCATTTLTEGVNLPVRSVLITAQGTFGPGGYTEFITGPTLLNAIGRAGRAARETEGWVVLARNADYVVEDFDRLEPADRELAALSNLAAAEVLDELARLEEGARAEIDVSFENFGLTVDAFVSVVWHLCRENPADVETFLESTLGWRK